MHDMPLCMCSTSAAHEPPVTGTLLSNSSAVWTKCSQKLHNCKHLLLFAFLGYFRRWTTAVSLLIHFFAKDAFVRVYVSATSGPAPDICRPGTQALRLCLVPVLLCSLLLLLTGCGLIFNNKDDGPRRPRSNMSAEVESTAQPLPYEVSIVLIKDDGTRVVDKPDTASAGKKGKKNDNDAEEEDAESEDAEDNGTEKETQPEPQQETQELSAAEDLARQKKEEEVAAHAPGEVELDDSAIVDGVRNISQLVKLHDTPPDGELGLEMRARQDVEAAVKFLASQGYYDGAANFEITGADTGKAQVHILLHPGRRYVVGDISIIFTPAPVVPAQLQERANFLFAPDRLPRIRPGRAVTAQEVLDSVQRLPVRLHNNGYPDAKILGEYYYLDRNRRTLNILVEIAPGEPATIGQVLFAGESSVSSEYLAKLVPWSLTEPVIWDERRVDRYVSFLRRTGLFANVTVVNREERTPGDGKDVPSKKNIGIALEDAKHRTVGGMVRYDTDTGLGAELHWEHRNLFGNGEKLSVTTPYTYTDKGVELEFTKPAFITRNQFFRVRGSALVEDTEAYERTGADLEAGVVRFWNRNWITFTGLFTDSGWLKNNEHDNRPYTIYGANLNIHRDTRNNRMNPASGTNAALKLKPMTGQYSGDFTALGAEFSLSAYWAPFKWPNGMPKDKLVFAGKASFGSYNGAQLRNIPSTQRYYMGGMDTVRGYGYQQIGPKDSNGDPIGGRSYQLLNLEARYKVTKDLGLVGFVDGGQLYTSEWPEFGTDMDWGAGIGVRYFTPIGPVRLDVAVPLEDVDPPLQFYISIGQSF